ncbi:hypothetical protein ES708_26554 [subsurface metagenome]
MVDYPCLTPHCWASFFSSAEELAQANIGVDIREMGMTYVRADSVAPAAGASAAVVVDLGLGIDEAAKILGIEIGIEFLGIFTAGAYHWTRAAYSFDPEDTEYSATDDEQFASCVLATSSIAASTSAQKQSEHVFFNFIGMDLVTTRNLALVGTSGGVPTGVASQVEGKVYYERFKPSAIELSQLIATRR